ncbi:hypothetical protein CR513_44321, partial [Mucuna pruriens]
MRRWRTSREKPEKESKRRSCSAREGRRDTNSGDHIRREGNAARQTYGDLSSCGRVQGGKGSYRSRELGQYPILVNIHEDGVKTDRHRTLCRKLYRFVGEQVEIRGVVELETTFGRAITPEPSRYNT